MAHGIRNENLKSGFNWFFYSLFWNNYIYCDFGSNPFFFSKMMILAKKKKKVIYCGNVESKNKISLLRPRFT